MAKLGTPEELQGKLGVTLSDQNLLRLALTHASAGEGRSYERLEFLGDRVLGLVVAKMLYKRFPSEPEGDLAKRLAVLAGGKLLAQIAREMDLGRYIIFSDAERQAGGGNKDSILADVFEALLGALYLDQGFKPCQDVIERFWHDEFFDMKAPPQHPKTGLQEWLQGRGLPLPEYRVTDQTGPDHRPRFVVTVFVEGYEPISAQGLSRQEAEKEAAASFLARYHKG